MSNEIVKRTSGSALAATDGLPYKERLKRLFESPILQRRQYETSPDDTKLVIPLPEFHDRETVEALEHVKAALEKVKPGLSEGVTFNGLFSEPALNLPIRLQDSLDERGAKIVFEAMVPIIDHMMAIHEDKKELLKLVQGGFNVRRTHFGQDGPTTYVFDQKDKVQSRDAIIHLADALNHALGVKPPLFTGVKAEWGSMVLTIKEKDLQALFDSPQYSKVEEIFKMPRHHSKTYHDRHGSMFSQRTDNYADINWQAQEKPTGNYREQEQVKKLDKSGPRELE